VDIASDFRALFRRRLDFHYFFSGFIVFQENIEELLRVIKPELIVGSVLFLELISFTF
jgi:hypothetical protein